MRKYMVNAILAVFAVITIGTYYVQASQETRPNYKLTMVQGDASLVEGIALYGNYMSKDSVFGIESAYITTNGTEYTDKKLTISQRFNRRPVKTQLDKWVDQHRQFMRGKNDLAGFYENQDILAYVNCTVDEMQSNNPSAKKNAKLSISVLNKQKDNTQEIRSVIHVDHDVSDIFVQNVQLVDQHLVAMVSLIHSAKGYVYEPQIIRVNLTTKEITNEPLTLPGAKSVAANGDNQYVRLANQNLDHTDQWILSVSKDNHKKSYQVDVKTGQISPLAFQGHEMLLNNIMNAYGQKIYFLQKAVSSKENIGFTVISYDLVSKEYETILKNTNIDLSDNITYVFKQDYLYIMGHKNFKGNRLYVFNLTSGNLEYEGKAVSTEAANQAEDEANMDLNYIDLGQF
ncbi:hypothetical protein M5X00_03240 [Paenibacillus alvei]|uniref:Uncharacterized protein n=1 Tax=Paenibacillus alvei TaxID=44250 RepID=A0ABT4H8E2_PAEAL|nr:hypothetical protein [Paenibacillus alvei]EJW15403.1 hypothetical protein PAV_8c00660 [Paenibacillus alvei DSM 29]MCY9544318.1 hypothetical protein [Paenibacillus alvei]MCY9706442.1 hypothetical protein [Paenibacillus alvei]MCY9736367.1 hypothetical protein [Paenibacillus alvei]MCY9753277.1 hypothetical protein [Paenibacillus alvei]